MILDDVLESVLLLGCVGICHHKLIVPHVLDILVDRHQVDIVHPDVDPQPRISVPEEVRHLLEGGHVVSRLQLFRPVEVLEEDVGRRFHTNPLKQVW